MKGSDEENRCNETDAEDKNDETAVNGLAEPRRLHAVSDGNSFTRGRDVRSIE